MPELAMKESEKRLAIECCVTGKSLQAKLTLRAAAVRREVGSTGEAATTSCGA
jgi:hypothetical protein